MWYLENNYSVSGVIVLSPPYLCPFYFLPSFYLFWFLPSFYSFFCHQNKLSVEIFKNTYHHSYVASCDLSRVLNWIRAAWSPGSRSQTSENSVVLSRGSNTVEAQRRHPARGKDPLGFDALHHQLFSTVPAHLCLSCGALAAAALGHLARGTALSAVNDVFLLRRKEETGKIKCRAFCKYSGTSWAGFLHSKFLHFSPISFWKNFHLWESFPFWKLGSEPMKSKWFSLPEHWPKPKILQSILP